MNTEFLKSKGPSAISRILGKSRQTVTNYINGDSCMTVDQALKLARHYGVSLSEVVDLDYRKANQDDLITALDAENRLLIAQINTIKSIMKSMLINIGDTVDTARECPKCGEKSDTTFCPNCGAKILED